MATMIDYYLRSIIDEQWHTRTIGREQALEISLWCFTNWGYPVGQLDPRTFDYNYRWHIETPTRTSLVTPPAFIAIKEERDLTMYLLRWGAANE